MTKGFVKFVWADAVSVPSAFNFVEGFAVLWLTSFQCLTPFNFVEDCAVLWLRRLNACGV